MSSFFELESADAVAVAADIFASQRCMPILPNAEILSAMLNDFLSPIERESASKTAFLNYFKHRITSGKIEGINNKIKTLKRQAYGFRDMEYFKLRLFHLHVQKYSFAG